LNLVRRCDAILNKLPKEGIITQLIGKSDRIKCSDEEEAEIYANAQSILNNAEDKLNKLEKLRMLKLSTKKQISLKILSLLKDNFIVLKKSLERTLLEELQQPWLN